MHIYYENDYGIYANLKEYLRSSSEYTYLYASHLKRIAYISNLTSPHNLHFYRVPQQ